MRITPEQKKGAAITIIIHLLLVLMLPFLALRTPFPLSGEEGVEVRMGDSDEGTFSENIDQLSVYAATAMPRPSAKEEEEIVTQTQEETVAVETSKKSQTQQKREEKSETQNPKPETQNPAPVVDPRALYTGDNTTSSGGGTGTSGNYGRPDGTSTTGGLTGGGSGNGSGSGSGNGQGSGFGNRQGHDYFLKGREIKLLQKPSYNSGEQGRVVVEISVDKDGNVVKARAGAKVPDTNLGTTISDQSLWKQAEEAALKSKFSKNDKATEQQKGYIVYNFVKQGE